MASNRSMEAILRPFVSEEWRAAWWQQLQRDQPEAAARMAAKFPDKYKLDSRKEV